LTVRTAPIVLTDMNINHTLPSNIAAGVVALTLVATAVAEDPSHERNPAADKPELVGSLAGCLREFTGPSPCKIVERRPTKQR